MYKKLFSISRAKLAFALGLFMAASMLGGSVYQAPKALAACDKVNIVYCGLQGSSITEYITHMKKLNSTGTDGTFTDMRSMLSWGGYTDSVIAGMSYSNTKVGTLYRDGHIEVAGKTVATKTWLTARYNGGTGFYSVKSGVWKRLTTTAMANASDAVLITFDANGKAIAGIVVHCGNTLQFTPTPVEESIYTPRTPTPKPPVVTPVYQCTGLTPATIDASKYQYRFTAKYSSVYATFQSATFDFGDGSKATDVKSTTAGSVTTEHSYKKSGTYKIVATLNFDAAGVTKTVTCSTSVATIVPFGKCVQLDAKEIDGFKKFTFMATMKYGNGAVFQGADFSFGDGNKAMGVTTIKDDTVTVDHTYDKAGNYSASAILHFSIDGTQYTAPTCYVKISPNEKPVPECKPGIPVGDKRCTPCEYDVNLTADDERCKAPVVPTETLPNTGSGSVVLLSLAALVGGFLFYRQRVFNKHKRDFVAAETGMSPLPLADPMSGNPLEDTPLEEPARSTLRRRRQF